MTDPAPAFRVKVFATLEGSMMILPLSERLAALFTVTIVADDVLFPIIRFLQTAAELIVTVRPELTCASSDEVGTLLKLQVPVSHAVPAERMLISSGAVEAIHDGEFVNVPVSPETLASAVVVPVPSFNFQYPFSAE